MKGVPLRIDLGKKEVEKKELTIFRRDLNKKETIKEKELLDYILKTSKEYDKNLRKKADSLFNDRIKDVSSKEEMKKAIESGKIARASFCSTDIDGAKCAEVIEKEIQATVRGKKFEPEKASGKCVICGKKAKDIVYIARQY